jgi:hypothetical protein
MRYAVAITGYCKDDKFHANNFISMSIITADSEDEAILKACGLSGVASKVLDGYKLFWKQAILINDDTEENIKQITT